MKLRILSNGISYQILEEFEDYDIIIYQGELLALEKSYPYERYNVIMLRDILVDVKNKNWRSQERKEQRIRKINQVCDALIRHNRDLKIDEVLRKESDYDILCLAC